MSLQGDRDKTFEAVRTGEPDARVTEWATRWFDSLKRWEAEETFERAFKDNRMTARVCELKETKEFKVENVTGVKSNLKLDVGVFGLEPRLNPQNFLDKKKNELGLHDLSAVLLRAGALLSTQLFKVDMKKYVVFMPIPLEEDLQLFEELSQAAKHRRDGPLYAFVVTKRAQFTRIKYGSGDDMAVGFLNITKADDKQHIRYGEATAHGAVLKPELLKQRSVNALHYKSKIALAVSAEGNNEVTLKIRAHAGNFPLVGKPMKDNRYSISGMTAPVGFLSDAGELTIKKD